jgi:hypothetical protein
MRVAFVVGVSLAFGLANTARAEETVEAFVSRYELALDRGDTELLRGVYEDWTVEKEGRLREYFSETVREFNVEFSDVEVFASDDAQALIRFVRRDRFTDVRSGRRIERELSLDRTLHRYGGLWRLAPISAPSWR